MEKELLKVNDTSKLKNLARLAAYRISNDAYHWKLPDEEDDMIKDIEEKAEDLEKRIPKFELSKAEKKALKRYITLMDDDRLYKLFEKMDGLAMKEMVIGKADLKQFNEILNEQFEPVKKLIGIETDDLMDIENEDNLNDYIKDSGIEDEKIKNSIINYFKKNIKSKYTGAESVGKHTEEETKKAYAKFKKYIEKRQFEDNEKTEARIRAENKKREEINQIRQEEKEKTKQIEQKARQEEREDKNKKVAETKHKRDDELDEKDNKIKSLQDELDELKKKNASDIKIPNERVKKVFDNLRNQNIENFEPWQAVDYISNKYPNLSEDEAKNLYVNYLKHKQLSNMSPLMKYMRPPKDLRIGFGGYREQNEELPNKTITPALNSQIEKFFNLK